MMVKGNKCDYLLHEAEVLNCVKIGWQKWIPLAVSK